MKRTAEGSAKTKSIAPIFTKEVKKKRRKDTEEEEKKGHWNHDEEDLWVYTVDGCEGRSKIVAFDMDGTLITTKSGKVFPQTTEDWKLLYDDIPKKIQKYYDEGYKIVIFSNQKGLQAGKVDKIGFKRKIQQITAKIGVPMQVFLSVGDAKYRKPSTGMWFALQDKNDGVKIDIKDSVYVGDAAGRHKTATRSKKDHSSADRFFAHNVGVSFKTPEQFFLGEKKEEPWGPPPFEPRTLFQPDRQHLTPDTKLPSEGQEIIVMCGFPGSGKSTFSKKLAKEHGYSIINQDTLSSWQKCVAAAKTNLAEGNSVVIDNTNPDVETRSRYIKLAEEFKVPCRCFEINCNMPQAQHNVRFRALTEKRKNEVNKMVLNVFQKKFTPPTREEGFDEVIKVNLQPDFESDELKNLYLQYLID